MISRYRVSNLIKDVNRKLHEYGVDMTSDFFGAMDEARRNMLMMVHPPELKRKAYIEQALYDQVDRYASPTDLSFENVIDINMVASRHNLDTLNSPLVQVYSRKFKQQRRHAENYFSVNYENGVKYMSIRHPRGLRHCEHLLLNACDSLTANGNWSVGGNVVNLKVDKVNHITGKASLQFDINDSDTTGFLFTDNMNPVSISSLFDDGSLFAWLELPVQGVIRTVTVRMGSDSGNYYEFATNQPHDGNEFATDWNLLGMRIDQFSQTGLPDRNSISYLYVEFNTVSETSMAKCHLDSVVARKGYLYEVTYESVWNIVSPNGYVWKQMADSSLDIIVAEETTYQCYMLETAKAIMQEAYGNSDRGNSDSSKIDQALQAAYLMYRGAHKTEAIEQDESTYVFGESYSGYSDVPMDQDSNYEDSWQNS